MNVNLRKLLLAAASCWLVLVCGSPERVEGAGQAATVDGILRSVVAVRTQLEPVAQNRLSQRTTPTRQGGLSCGGVIRVPGLQRLFNCVTPDRVVSPVAPPPQFTVEARVNDKPQQQSTVEIIASDQRATWSTYSDGTSSAIRGGNGLPHQGDPAIGANPLALIIPTQEQLQQFQQWQRPYQHPSKPVTTTRTTTTTAAPDVDEIYFPPSVDEPVPVLGTVRPTQHYTTAAPAGGSIAERVPWETSSWASVGGNTKDPSLEEEVTTEPPREEEEEEEHGLGNRIDHKLLLSLVG
ncbi:uncharacterized protein LOC121590303 [Anopheles merus]|uniref:Uncharacterized protein n=1 Tax=Anopheles merus TaxID=30066 RepID=A0A182UQV0_ANOME|nr:uncharacterized protein LOC121590303 [Anopheles merus]XP_041765777.1 uncharacterized protein LOC121590303 [Anopheles merus]XP_041765778.1 uncharacterized protein LOC121590303 [Anopheles merus]